MTKPLGPTNVNGSKVIVVQHIKDKEYLVITADFKTWKWILGESGCYPINK